jgi:hypothetical protein
MSELNEISKKLRFIEKAICCISTSNLDLLSKTPTTTGSRNLSLTGSSIPLDAEACIAVEILVTEALIIEANGGDTYMPFNPSTIFIYTTDASNISVTGNSTLNYFVIK